MTRTMISFRIDQDVKRQFQSKLALEGKSAQNFLENAVKNYIHNPPKPPKKEKK